MEHHREPIKHTCPDIDKVIKSIEKINKLSHLKGQEDFEEVKDLLSDINSECWGIIDVLESLRKSNEDLRSWAITEAKEVDSLEEKIYLKELTQ